MVQAASCPPLQRTQGRGTHGSGTGRKSETEGWATRLHNLPELQTTGATNGGVLIASSETSDNLVINGGLED